MIERGHRSLRIVGRLMIAVAIAGALGSWDVRAQIAEFDFYPPFRTWLFTLPSEQRQPVDAVIERYETKLRGEGVDAAEVQRRVTLVRTRRAELEADFWNRFFTVDAPAFNTAPNAFLVSVVQGRPPGRALDVGMGEGRNALYLAKLGWDVTGFDPADKAVALAQQRAKQLGLTIRTEVTRDRDFAFGDAQWDLILLSYMPPFEAARMVPALKPGGIVVFEGPREWFPRNGLLKAFDALRVIRYEDAIRDDGDFFQGKRIPVLRFLAERPRD